MLLPVGPLAVPAAVLDEAAAGAARQGGLMALAMGSGAGVVAGGGLLLLGWHGFGRRRKKGEGLGKPQQPPIENSLKRSDLKEERESKELQYENHSASSCSQT